MGNARASRSSAARRRLRSRGRDLARACSNWSSRTKGTCIGPSTVRFEDAGRVARLPEEIAVCVRTARTDVALVARRLEAAQGPTRPVRQTEALIATTTSLTERATSLRTWGYADSTERQARLRLALALNRVIDQRALTQAEVAKLLGVSQPEASASRNVQALRVLSRTADDISDRTRLGRAYRDPPRNPDSALGATYWSVEAV